MADAHGCFLKIRQWSESEPCHDGKVKHWLALTLTDFRMLMPLVDLPCMARFTLPA
ncbi:hypothetical protein [Polaromonas sp. CG9_12]|nr:hypothetical protein [Polaromonas sp. CG9_12]